MKKNILLMGITILAAARTMCAADVHDFACDGEKTPVFNADGAVPSQNVATIGFSENVADTLTLRTAVVNANFAHPSRSALRLATVDEEKLRQRGTSRTYPELLKGLPGLYATSESGSYGDAKLNIRGFGQENISVLLNGIPISGLVTGGMYWNNWMGLADATLAVQVQKGVGASMLSDGSVGGSVNIITESPSERFSAEAGFYGSAWDSHSAGTPAGGQASPGNSGPFKGYLKLGSGRLRHGWSMNLMASYVGGNGYVESTPVSSFAYMFSLAKSFGDEHRLIFTSLGSPESHEQRSSRLSAAEVGEHGLRYNKNWGWRGGKAFNLSKNNYFKPYFTLQHLWDGPRVSMKNSLYIAIGNGGGRWSETKGRPISSFTTADGHIDWDAAVLANRNPDGSANNILSQYMAGHTQAGAIISAEYRLTDRWTLGGGLHGQLYHTWERERLTDLLGADWWFEDYENKSLAGAAGRNAVKGVGDYVRTDNGKQIYHGTAYLTVKYDSKNISADFGASLFGSANRRWDKYNYVGSDIFSKTAHGTGASVKGGLLWRPGRGHGLYLNGGWYSRLPYSNVWFSSGNNEITRGVKNERNILGELGWRCVWASGNFELTGYAARWKNKSLMSDKYRQIDSEDARYMVTGLDAFHCGVEASLFQRVGTWLELNAFASVGDWRWKNDVSAIIYDDYSGTETGRVNVYCDGLPVGDAPQTQVGACSKFLIPAGFSISLEWQFNDRMYADFDPLTRTAPSDRRTSYRIPGCHLLGADVSWGHDFRIHGASQWRGLEFGSGEQANNDRKIRLRLFLRGDNLLNTSYIERGKDGVNHDLETFRGFWGIGRTFSFGMRIGL